MPFKTTSLFYFSKTPFEKKKKNILGPHLTSEEPSTFSFISRNPSNFFCCIKSLQQPSKKKTKKTVNKPNSQQVSQHLERRLTQTGSQNFPTCQQRINQLITFSSVISSTSIGEGGGWGGLTCRTDWRRDRKMDGRKAAAAVRRCD